MKNKTIKTTNLDWGFYGTLKSIFRLGDKTASKSYDLMAHRVIELFSVTEIEAVEFLDSRMGRHMADNFTYFFKKDAINAVNNYSVEKIKEYYDWFKKSD